MKILLMMLALLLVLAGCGAESEERADTGGGDTAPLEPVETPDAGSDAAPVDCGPIVETHLPAAGSGTVIRLCTACSNSCSTRGEPCDRWGDPCGDNGVCAACCSGTLGELRCKTTP